jgi:NADPH:quinone reductase-like Zn-dependent oxidoreductase
MMKYKSVAVTARGGTEVLKVVENELREPSIGEARIRILAAPVCQDDIEVRKGNRPFLAKIPFVPGYSFIGEVDAVGEGVSEITVGDQVAALTNFGSYAEYIYWKADQLVIVPKTLDPAEAVVLILNYLVAYQTMNTVVQIKPGDKVLIIGASGGVGTAYLQLGQLAGLKMYGLASPAKHNTLTQYGAIPIDYHTQDFVEVLREIEPEGLDYVFNGMGEEYLERGLKVLQRGGVLVHYGAPRSFRRLLSLIVKFGLYNLLPNGKSIKGYGTHREEVDKFKRDWLELFRLLEEEKIEPIIAAKYPILGAAKANEMLESGQVTGNVVLLTPELLEGFKELKWKILNQSF